MFKTFYLYYSSTFETLLAFSAWWGGVWELGLKKKLKCRAHIANEERAVKCPKELYATTPRRTRRRRDVAGVRCCGACHTHYVFVCFFVWKYSISNIYILILVYVREKKKNKKWSERTTSRTKYLLLIIYEYSLSKILSFRNYYTTPYIYIFTTPYIYIYLYSCLYLNIVRA